MLRIYLLFASLVLASEMPTREKAENRWAWWAIGGTAVVGAGYGLSRLRSKTKEQGKYDVESGTVGNIQRSVVNERPRVSSLSESFNKKIAEYKNKILHRSHLEDMNEPKPASPKIKPETSPHESKSKDEAKGVETPIQNVQVAQGSKAHSDDNVKEALQTRSKYETPVDLRTIPERSTGGKNYSAESHSKGQHNKHKKYGRHKGKH